MQYHLIVSFGKNSEFAYKFADSASLDDARRWFEHEYSALNCVVETPTGKILVVDRILSVAKFAGEERFREQRTWAEQFARYAAAILGRELIRIDVEHYCIGY